MSEASLVKMSTKGQLVVPESIRKAEAFEPGDRFIPVAVDDGVLFKKVNIPELKAEFEKLSVGLRTHLRNEKVSSRRVDEAVKWTRQKK